MAGVGVVRVGAAVGAGVRVGAAVVVGDAVAALVGCGDAAGAVGVGWAQPASRSISRNTR